MNFLFSAVPAILGSTAFKNVIGGITNSLWNSVKARGTEALLGMAGDALTVRDQVIRKHVVPAVGSLKRRYRDYEETYEKPLRKRVKYR